MRRNPHGLKLFNGYNDMTLQELNEITSRETLTLVDFYAAWCGPCRAMHPVLDKLAEEAGGMVDIRRIDIDKPENVEAVRQHKIMAVPTLILFRKGRILWRESGVVPLKTLLEVVRRYDKVEVF